MNPENREESEDKIIEDVHLEKIEMDPNGVDDFAWGRESRSVAIDSTLENVEEYLMAGSLENVGYEYPPSDKEKPNWTESEHSLEESSAKEVWNGNDIALGRFPEDTLETHGFQHECPDLHDDLNDKQGIPQDRDISTSRKTDGFRLMGTSDSDSPPISRHIEAESWTMKKVMEPQADSLDNDPLATGGINLSQEQIDFVGPGIDNADLYLLADGHSNQAFRAHFGDDQIAVYKPSVGEVPLRNSIECGTYWKNEIAAYRVDRLLDFGLVPVTAPADGQDGLGSIQVCMRDVGTEPTHYDFEDQQMLGTLDYILASLDRHEENFMTQDIGRPSAIDNGLCLPPDNMDAIRSVFIKSALETPLNAKVLEKVRSVTAGELADELGNCGIGEESIKGAVERLREAQSGLITGRAWAGRIEDEDFNVLVTWPR